ncbi:MAG TPA: zf-HC2 domain-containing protein [Gemmatimonadales bacterium]
MSHDSHWSDLLTPYLDGELDAETQRQLEDHLAACAPCRALLADLRAIVSAAPGYRGAPPQRDLWPGIAAGIDRARVVPLPGRTPPRLFTLRQLMAASVLLAAAAGGLAWFAARGAGPAAPVSVAAGPGEPASLRLAAVNPRADSAYDGAVADLEAVLSQGRGRLDSATVRVIEQSLLVIDQAITEARAAIAADPANAYLNGQIAANMRRKLDLLRRAATAIEASAS